MSDQDLEISGLSTATRSDPFGRGMIAFSAQEARADSPHRAATFETSRWEAGWDYAADRATFSQRDLKHKDKSAKAGPIGERDWTLGDVLVLKTLAQSGETLAGLALRLRRPAAVIRTKCSELGLVLP